MQDVEVRGLDALNDRLKHFLRQVPQKRREFHERMGDVMQQEVRAQIAVSVNDSRGRVVGWQRKYVGSGGGYAAVRAEDTSTGDNSPGAVTNYLENGHIISSRRQSGGRVSGRHFYLNTRMTIGYVVEAEAADFANELAALLED